MANELKRQTKTERVFIEGWEAERSMVRKGLSGLNARICKAQSFEELNQISNTAKSIRQQYSDVKEIADEAGIVWVNAERHLGSKLAETPRAKGTRGQLAGKKAGTGKGQGKAKSLSGGTTMEPPETNAPTLAEMGVDKKRAARDARLAAIPANKLQQYINELSNEGKGVTPDAVLRKQRAENKTTVRQDLAKPVFSEKGPFDCVVIDPPWPVQKIDRDVRPNQDSFDYPTMTVEEIAAFWKRELSQRIKDDCHLFMWTTNKLLPEAIALLSQIGFRYVLTMVWHKPGGFQPLNLPQYNCEFVVYARYGKPQFIDTKGFKCCFNGERREHSRKPDEFYDMIKRTTGGSRIDIFSREKREGFSQFGNETKKFS